MTNTNKQIDYWIRTAEEDLSTAEILIRENRTLHGLFFCHLVIEKAIKAHFVKSTGENAPRTHNIMYLSDRAGLSFDEESQIFMGILMKYQLEGRYPDYNPTLPERKKIIDYYDKTKNLFQWLKKKL